MRRRQVPMVPAPTHSPMPDKQRSEEDKSRLFSVYLRPWVLDTRFASAHVPHVIDLDLVPAVLTPSSSSVRRRVRGKQARDPQIMRSFSASWTWYIRGHVVSQEAKCYIIQFLAACCGKSKTRDDTPEDDNEAEAKINVIPPNSPTPYRWSASTTSWMKWQGQQWIPGKNSAAVKRTQARRARK